MIAPLRKLHRRGLPILAVGSFALIGAALAVRTDMPAQSLESSDGGNAAGLELDGIWGELSIETRAWNPSSRRRLVSLRPRVDLRSPDVLVYWTEPPTKLDKRPADAVLLGKLSGVEQRTFVLPEASGNSMGALYLYSLAHAEVLAAASLGAPR